MSSSSSVMLPEADGDADADADTEAVSSVVKSMGSGLGGGVARCGARCRLVRLPFLTVVERRTSSWISMGGVGFGELSGENKRRDERGGWRLGGESVKEGARCGVSGRIGGE